MLKELDSYEMSLKISLSNFLESRQIRPKDFICLWNSYGLKPEIVGLKEETEDILKEFQEI